MITDKQEYQNKLQELYKRVFVEQEEMSDDLRNLLNEVEEYEQANFGFTTKGK
jgi:hypothetical protein